MSKTGKCRGRDCEASLAISSKTLPHPTFLPGTFRFSQAFEDVCSFKTRGPHQKTRFASTINRSRLYSSFGHHVTSCLRSVRCSRRTGAESGSSSLRVRPTGLVSISFCRSHGGVANHGSNTGLREPRRGASCCPGPPGFRWSKAVCERQYEFTPTDRAPRLSDDIQIQVLLIRSSLTVLKVVFQDTGFTVYKLRPWIQCGATFEKAFSPLHP
jgi:hypothetical protein